MSKCRNGQCHCSQRKRLEEISGAFRRKLTNNDQSQSESIHQNFNALFHKYCITSIVYSVSWETQYKDSAKNTQQCSKY